MNKKTARKLVNVLLAFVMLFGCFTRSVNHVTAESSSTWEKVSDIAAAASSGKSVAITMTTSDGKVFAMPTAQKNSKGAPMAIESTVNDSGILTIGGVETEFGWAITLTDDGYNITDSAGEYLYVTADNNGVRVGKKPSVGANWTLDQNYMTASDSNGTQRYLGIFNGTDWRCYTSINNNIKNQTLEFWTIKESGEPEPEPEPIAQLDKFTAAPEKDSKVVIYNPENKLTLTETVSGKKLAGVSTTFDGEKLNQLETMAYLDVVINNNNEYLFKNKDGKYLTSGETGSSLSFEETANDYSLWTLEQQEDGTWYIVNVNALYNGSKQAIQYYSGFTTYGVRDNNAAYKYEFYGVKPEQPVEPVKYTVTVNPSENGEVTVDKNEAEEGDKVTITVTPNEGYELEKLLVNDVETTVSDNKATVTVAGDLIISATFKLVEEPAAEDVYLDKLTELPVDGSKVIIYHPASSKVLSTEANGKILNGIDATVTDNRIAVKEGMALLTVSVNDDNQYIFANADGKYLTSGDTGKSLSFTDTVTDMSKWTITKREDGLWVLNNVGANYNGNYNQALEYYNGFTTYGIKDTDAYWFDFYGEVEKPVEGLINDLDKLTDGTKVVIYNESSAKAISSTVLGTYYLSGADVTIKDDKVVDPSKELIWTVGVTEESDGSKTYTFSSSNGKKMSMNNDKNSLPLDAENTGWLLKSATTENAYYIINKNRSEYYIEWYARYTEFSTYKYSSSNEAIYAMKLYAVTESDTPVEPVTGDSYGLTSTIADGDEVILYHDGVGLGNTLSGFKISGTPLTVTDGVITTDKTEVVWTVVDNKDGTYSFKQGDMILGGVVSGSFNNLVVTGADYTKWTMTGPDSTDFNYFMYLKDMTSSFGNVYLEYYNGFTLYGSSTPNKAAFGITFYKKGAEPETPAVDKGDLITDLADLKDGATVAIYSPGHKTAISSIPNGDWYLRANQATVKDGKVTNFTDDFVWTVKKNEDGTYSFYAYGDDSRSITVWPSGNYAELSLNVATYPENKWNVTPAKTDDCFYIHSPTVSGERGPAYIEAYVRNEFEVFSGYFTNESSNAFKDNEFALQFYLINPEDAIEAYDDGEWDGVLEKDSEYVVYNASAGSSLGLYKEANYALDAIPTTIEGNLATPGNGAYAFKIDTMGRYYTFEVDGKYLATNEAEELLFVSKDENGKIPENAKWFLNPKNGSYIIYNKDARYNGTPVCIEYFSSVFSGWTYSTKNPVEIYLFDFYKVAEDVKVYKNVVQDPSVVFECEDSRHLEEDYPVSFTLDDLADEISSIKISYKVGERVTEVTDYESSGGGKSYSFELKAEDIDQNEKPDSMTIVVEVENSYGITYTGEKVVEIIDEPFFTDLTPAPNTQTGEDKRPVISAKVGNVGENPVFVMTVNDEEVESSYNYGVVSYTPTEDLKNGRATVKITVTRADGVTGEKTWSFIVGNSEYQLYFGQLHSHTTYSDGSGSLETALDYIASLPESANVDFVAFTDHSNYFDTTSAANPADAMNDASLMTPASAEVWNKYKGTVAAFNERQSDIVAIAGYEMTWSGGPGHINSYNTAGIVSRNNAQLNVKDSDAGMRLYYATMNKDNGETLHQFNHPGTTFGNFNDFSYWDAETDKRIFLVEVGNGEGQIGAGGYYPSYEQYTLALDKGWHLAPTNNQDNHKGRWGNANDARDVVLTNDFSEQGIYDAIRQLRVYATEDKNLEITYTVNGEQLGTVFTDENSPKTLHVEVSVYDPDATDSTSKVELVVNNNTVAYTWNDAEELSQGLLTCDLDAEYTYYFVRVTQKDGDLAVTAPVWVGHALEMGIEKVISYPDELRINNDTKITTTFFNNESADATIKSIVYTQNGSKVLGTDTTGYTLGANSSLPVDFTHIFTEAKHTTVTITAVVEYEGKEHVYTRDFELDIMNDKNVTSPISEVRAASKPDDTGYMFMIEGVVTSNASGYDKDTAFFDCIYVQDSSGGICVFPVSGDYKVGDIVRVVGYTDFYQGEPELQVVSLEKVGETSVKPTNITAGELNNRSAEGKLVTINGTVESFEEVNGLVQTIMVKDAAGNLARVFVDGYITTDSDVERLMEGSRVTVTGLASYDDTWPDTDYFPRIRIRDRKDIVCDQYQIIEGAESEWQKGSGKDLTIVSNAPNEKFEGVYVDGRKVDESNYDRVSGSTRITFKSAYLEKLSSSRHNVVIRSTDGSASTTMTIKDKEKPDGPTPKPDGGGSSTIGTTYILPMTGVDE